MSKTNYTGINYGKYPMENGKLPNVDDSTNIRYGIIPVNSVCQVWCDSSEPDYPCRGCDYEQGSNECSNAYCEPVGYFVKDSEYKAFCDDYGDIFITKSLYYTYAQFCSPCAPGACYLLNTVSGENTDNKCYCFGQDWFDDEIEPCPYPVYEVATGKCIYQPKEEK